MGRMECKSRMHNCANSIEERCANPGGDCCKPRKRKRSSTFTDRHRKRGRLGAFSVNLRRGNFLVPRQRASWRKASFIKVPLTFSKSHAPLLSLWLCSKNIAHGVSYALKEMRPNI